MYYFEHFVRSNQRCKGVCKGAKSFPINVGMKSMMHNVMIIQRLLSDFGEIPNPYENQEKK